MASKRDNEEAGIEGEAIRMLAAGNLHQRLWIPQTDSHDRLRVTFSTTKNFHNDALPTVLFIGPMFSTRWFAADLDSLCEQAGVRTICVDRPGFGGSTHVPATQRIAVWLEAVPLILEKLNVKHVALVSHSAGTLYALNTLGQLRNILHPKAPFVAYLGPWVHSEHSRSMLMSVVTALPASMISSTYGLVRLVNLHVEPASTWSGGLLTSAASSLWPSSEPTEESESDDYGADDAMAKKVQQLRKEYCFAEEPKGVSEEALLCAKKAGPDSWGVCENYADFVQSVTANEERRITKEPGAVQLKVRLCFAETDIMIGDGGRDYFVQVWSQAGVSDVIDVRNTSYPGTNHDSVLADFKKGALPDILKEIGNLSV